MENNLNFIGDIPITTIKEDLFNFEHYASKVQTLIQANSNNSDPLTFGIYGKWGEGKTSFLNLIENKIDLWKKSSKDKGILKYHFNPWRYSTEEEMLFDFFDGLAKSMFLEKNTNLKKVGKGILKFSRYLKAVKISASIGISSSNKLTAAFEPSEILKALGEDFVGKDVTLDKLKDEINVNLKKANYKVAVFIDDLDRLDKEEIYTILKLVKLNGNFQNFIYLITLDSEQVSKAISKRYGDEIQDGKFFLEKIINIPIHLPRIEEEDLKYFFEIKFKLIKDNLFSILKTNKEEELKLIIYEFSGKFFDSPREILRVLNSFFIGAFSIGDEVNLRDLFWIESLKVKDEKLHSNLKNYQIDGFQFINTAIDFNDKASENAPLINGTRANISQKHSKSFSLFNLLFPIKTSKFPLSKPLDTAELDRNLKINSVLHYEKYFSYHSLRKVSNVKLKMIEQKIKEENVIELKELLKDFFNEGVEHKVYYKFEDLIKNTSVHEGRNFFFEFVLENLSLLPEYGKDLFGIDSLSRIVEDIAKILVTDKVIDDDLIIKLANKLDVNQLCHFTRKFKDDLPIKLSLERLIVDKTVFSVDGEPFYYKVSNMPNKMIMKYWRKHESQDFLTKIEESLDSKKSIALLIRNFPGFWNGEYFGTLTKQNYDYMKSLIDVDLVIKKLISFDKSLVDMIDVKSYEFTDKDENTIEESVEQFVYWYKLEQSQK